jgi:hypothetical protein
MVDGGLLYSWFGRTIIKPLASLKLTVVLFGMAIFLVLAGTLAQVDEDIHTVLGKYFRSWGVLIPLKIFGPRSWNLPMSIPFPGGWIIGGALLVNLLAAHAIRFRMTWARAGILITHAGLMLLLIGELVTGVYAVEGNMTIYNGKSSNFIEDLNAYELAVIDASDPSSDNVTVVPHGMLRPGRTVSDPALPFDVSTVEYYPNSNGESAARESANPATSGAGLKIVAKPAARVSGANPSQSVNMPAAYVTFFKKGSTESLGTYMVAVWHVLPQSIVVEGKSYDLYLRFKRTYKPYTIHLYEFRHDRYQGTNIPKNFSSRVRLIDRDRGVNREALIYMNHPLRYAGETFYQSSFKPGDAGTVLQVVENPGWLLPYLSCILVSLGLIAHFVLRLMQFLSKRAA